MRKEVQKALGLFALVLQRKLKKQSMDSIQRFSKDKRSLFLLPSMNLRKFEDKSCHTDIICQ